MFFEFEPAEPCHFQLNHARRTDPQARPRVAMLPQVI
jgi:hypothetical protein